MLEQLGFSMYRISGSSLVASSTAEVSAEMVSGMGSIDLLLTRRAELMAVLGAEVRGFGAASSFLFDPNGYRISEYNIRGKEGASQIGRGGAERNRGHLPELMIEQGDFRRIEVPSCSIDYKIDSIFVWDDQTADEAMAAKGWFTSHAHEEWACYRHLRVWLTGGPWKPRTLPEWHRPVACQMPLTIQAPVFRWLVADNNCQDASSDEVSRATDGVFNSCDEVQI